MSFKDRLQAKFLGLPVWLWGVVVIVIVAVIAYRRRKAAAAAAAGASGGATGGTGSSTGSTGSTGLVTGGSYGLGSTLGGGGGGGQIGGGGPTGGTTLPSTGGTTLPSTGGTTAPTGGPAPYVPPGGTTGGTTAPTGGSQIPTGGQPPASGVVTPPSSTSKLKTACNIDVSPKQGKVGSSCTVSVIVTDIGPSPGKPAGTITIAFGAQVKTATAPGGSVTFKVGAPTNGKSHNVKAVYAGNAAHSASTSPTVVFTVTK